MSVRFFRGQTKSIALTRVTKRAVSHDLLRQLSPSFLFISHRFFSCHLPTTRRKKKGVKEIVRSSLGGISICII
jgi:hypothetical protein